MSRRRAGVAVGLTIKTTKTCAMCGVVVLKRVGRCPSCHTWLGRRLIVLGVGAALLVVASTCALIGIRRIWWPPAPRLSIQISAGICLRSPDQRGTDALASINNPNSVPVDVTLSVRGFDITDRSVVEKTIGPFRNLPAGGNRAVQAYIDGTPLKSVAFEAVRVTPVTTEDTSFRRHARARD